MKKNIMKECKLKEMIEKIFTEILNKSRSVVADELMFIATHNFFDNMSKDEIMRWADTCMDFVYND